MAARGFAAALIVISTVLAGCINGGNDTVPVKATTNQLGSNATCFDSCSSIVAFEETNKTEVGAGGVDHPHDYWAGRERVTLFTTDAAMDPTPGSSASIDFRPPQGTFVWEGTDHIEFTLSNPQRHACEPAFTLGGQFICHDNLNNQSEDAPKLPGAPDPTGGPPGLKLRYKHAATVAWIDAGEVTWGKPIVIKVTHPTQTDMPHATSSSWEFQVASPNSYDSTLEFSAKAEIVRGIGDIPRWPGHPDFYADSPSRKVLDADAVACDTQGCQLPGNEKAGPISAQKLISYGTRTLYVWLNITDVQAPAPPLEPTSWFLFHSNSTGQQNGTNTFDSAKHPFTQKEHAWVLPVDDNGMDSPYGDGSKWEFALGGSLVSPVLSCYSGCAAWSAKYHITIIATNKALDLKDYEMFCIHTENYCPKP
ncbi:MAG: hypothetical protein WDA16_08405 [Candidatus Thermoplasmatota archaeon]